MRAGQLNRRVVLERVSESQNSFGEIDEVWLPLATMWARFVPLKGEEKFQARQFNPELSGEFHFRFRDCHPKDRIRWTSGDKTRIFQIESVIDVDDQNREIRATVEEQV